MTFNYDPVNDWFYGEVLGNATFGDIKVWFRFAGGVWEVRWQSESGDWYSHDSDFSCASGLLFLIDTTDDSFVYSYGDGCSYSLTVSSDLDTCVEP